jgi:hypothetical protein
MNIDHIKTFIAENIKYKDWEFYVGVHPKDDEHCYVQLRFMAPDHIDPSKIEKQHCRKWQLSVWMTPTEIVQTCWAAVARAEMHEASELFLYKGADIFNTHVAVDALAEACHAGRYEHRGDPKKT